MLSLLVKGERSSLSLSILRVTQPMSPLPAVEKVMTTEAKAERDVSSNSQLYEFRSFNKKALIYHNES